MPNSEQIRAHWREAAALARIGQLEGQLAETLEALKWTLDWLSSFSMPPTSTSDEKKEAMAVLEKAISNAEGRTT